MVLCQVSLGSKRSQEEPGPVLAQHSSLRRYVDLGTTVQATLISPSHPLAELTLLEASLGLVWISCLAEVAVPVKQRTQSIGQAWVRVEASWTLLDPPLSDVTLTPGHSV